MKTNSKFFAHFLLLILACAAPSAARAQKPATAATNINETNQATAAKRTVAVRDLKLDSKLMRREMPYRVILPANYDEKKSEKFAVLYLLHGLTGSFDNWADKSQLKTFAADYQYIIVMPEGANGWYTDSATAASDRYESYIVEELIPEIDKNFRTAAERNSRAIAGLSMGGYGSLKFGLKYPEKFVLAGSFSGALGAASWTPEVLGGRGVIAESISRVYGAAGSKTRAENDIFKMLRETTPERAKTLPFVYLDCGTEDFLIQSNRDFAALLLEKKIPHEFRQLPGRHDWAYWNSQIEEFLDLSERFLSRAEAKTD